jgi:hypothetical protein
VTSLDEIQRAAKLSDEEVVALVNLPAMDMNDLLDPRLTHDDLALIVRAKQESAAPAVVTSLDVFLKVISTIVTVAGAVIPIATAVTSVLGVVKSAQSA